LLQPAARCLAGYHPSSQRCRHASPGDRSIEWRTVQADIASLRERYQRLFAAKQQSGRAIN
jgi:hypothetical protein